MPRISFHQKLLQYFALASLLSARSFRTLASITIIDLEWIDGWKLIDPPRINGRQFHQARAEMWKLATIYWTRLLSRCRFTDVCRETQDGRLLLILYPALWLAWMALLLYSGPALWITKNQYRHSLIIRIDGITILIYKACLTSGKSFSRYPKPTLLYQREEQELSLYKVKDDESANAISTEKEADL